jgi:hypothetical protein
VPIIVSRCGGCLPWWRSTTSNGDRVFDQQSALECRQRGRSVFCRWEVEVFFKQIKQSLQLCDFLGNSANAVRWQVWTALLLYALMRFLCVMSSWHHSFTRLFRRCGTRNCALRATHRFTTQSQLPLFGEPLAFSLSIYAASGRTHLLCLIRNWGIKRHPA